MAITYGIASSFYFFKKQGFIFAIIGKQSNEGCIIFITFMSFMVKLYFLWTKKYLFDLVQGDRSLAEGNTAVVRGNFAVQPDIETSFFQLGNQNGDQQAVLEDAAA